MTKLEISTQGVARLTLNRPQKRNAFDDEVIQELLAALAEVESDETAWCMVLEAEGDHFSAGADLAWMRRMAQYTEAENLSDAKALAHLMQSLNGLSKPTIARVQGAAMGGAVGLVSCCDIVVAATNARFCLSEVKLGLIPATISPYVIAAIGARAARRYFLSAEVFNAHVALSLGLVSEVCEPDALDSAVAQLIEQLQQNGRRAMRAAKQLVADVDGAPFSEALIADTCERIAKIRVSEEGQEGLGAFLEKRKPAWTKKSSS